MIDRRGFGRFAEPARLVLVALRGGPRSVAPLFDEVRSLDGPVGPGTLYAAIARLERKGLIAAAIAGDGRPAYRLTEMSMTAGAVPGGVL
jgi:DNA-binding PadR family transcriptional regulator